MLIFKVVHNYSLNNILNACSFSGIDSFCESIKPIKIVDISSTIKIKEKMLAMHDSQRGWLMSHNGIDEYIVD